MPAPTAVTMITIPLFKRYTWEKLILLSVDFRQVNPQLFCVDIRCCELWLGSRADGNTEKCLIQLTATALQGQMQAGSTCKLRPFP